MGVDRDRPQILTMDVVETGRRRRWSDAEKLRIVEESLSGPRLVAATARRNDMTRSLLTRWRKLHAEGRLFGGANAALSFAPVVVATDAPVSAAAGLDASRIEIVLTNGRRIVIGAGADATALARVIAVVDRV